MAPKRIFIIIIVVLITTGIKLYYAHIASFYIYCDKALAGLIAKQILKGEFPLFFYGGFYTWVIESWVIAIFFFLFGISNFTIHLGPIFASILFLISVYLLGKEFKSREVGLLSLIYSAFPPFYFFKYSVIPVGYLSVLPLFGNVLFLLTFIIIRKRGIFYFCLLGVIGAFSFWLHFIALYYLASTAIFLFINMIVSRRFRYYLLGGISSLVSFFIGGLPCWLFNIRHNLASFSFSDTSFSLDSLRRFVTYQVPGILGNDLITIAIFIAAAILVFTRKAYKNWLFILFLISMAILFSRGGRFTRSKDYRYIIPIFSIAPILIAYLIEWINRRTRIVGIGVFSVLILINGYNIRKGILHDKDTFKVKGDMYDELIDYFIKHKIDGVYGMLGDVNTITFLGKDKVYAAEVIDSANPFDEKVIGSRRIAYLNKDYCRPVFNMLCRSYKYDTLGGYSIIYDFQPWGYYGEEILPSGWKCRSNYNHDWSDWAFDRNLDRYWSSITPKKGGMYYEIEFPEVYKIYKFQVFNMPTEFSYRNLPTGYKVYTSMDGMNWGLVSGGSAWGIFWSGPHVLWRQRNTLWEVLFNPVETRFLRIENIQSDGYNMPWKINEIFIYRYTGEKKCKYRNYIYNARKIYNYIVDKGIRFVYTDYWLSEKIREWSRGDIQSLRIYNHSWLDRPNTSRFMRLGRDKAIVVNSENEKTVEKILAEMGIRFRKICIGDYICFYFNEDISIESLYWTGAGISRINLRAFGKLLLDSGDYLKAVKYFPTNPNLRYRLLEMYKKNGRWDLYKREKQFIRNRFSPGVEKNVKFNKGIEFLGLDWQQLSGDIYRINYFWKLDENLKEKIFVFVHFIMDGKIIFQNDHPLLGQFIKLPILLPDEVWKESYIIKIPMSVPRGRYTIRLGLWNGSKRLRISGSKSTAVSIDGIEIGKNRLLKDLKGRMVFQSNVTGNKELYMMNADGGNVKRITHTDKDSSYANWSPDARDIVFMSNRNGNNEIYIIDSNGENLRNLTNSSAGDINPSWHPDGNRIIFVSDREGAMNFYLIDRDGSNLTKVTDFVDGVHDMPRISPDGEEIIFTSNMSMGWQIFKVGIDGKNLQRLSNLVSGHCEGIWAHRSNKILFVSRLGGNSEIYVMDRDGSNEQRLTTHDALDYNPRFSPDDKKIIFSTDRDGNWELYVMSIDDHKPVRITYTDFQEEWPDWVYE